MWPRKYGWLNFVILECSLDVWIVNKIVFAAPELCESALPNPKFLLHCRKWRNINLSWRKFQTSISSTLRIFFLVKTYKRDQWNLPNILAYTRGVQKVRGPTKKENEFYDETRCEGCYVIKTTPDAATSQSVLLLCSGCWLL